MIVPVYNGAKYLREALNSCLTQDLLLEIILIEDASTDESLDILHEYEQMHPDIIRIIQHSDNKGFVSGVIDGMAIAKGEYISIFGQDDVMLDGRMQILIKAIQESSASMICSNALFIFGEQPSKKLVRPDWYKTGLIPKHAFLFKNSVVGSSVIFKKTDFERINFLNYPFRNSMEWYHWFNYTCMDGAYFLASPLIYYRRHNTNLSSKLHNSPEYKTYKKFCRRYILSKLTALEIASALKEKILGMFSKRTLR